MLKNNCLCIGFIAAILLTSCYSNDDLEYQFNPKMPGQINILGYAQNDTVNIIGKENDTIMLNESSNFINAIQAMYEFSFEENQTVEINIISEETSETIGTLEISPQSQILEVQQDTLTFFYKPSIFIEDVFRFESGELSQPSYTGFKLMFPNLNVYSNSAYEGEVDAILTRFPTGQLIERVENIGTENFSAFVEFPVTDPAAPPIPIINMEIVKHGTNESYLPEGSVQQPIQLPIEEGASRLLLIEEVLDESGNFGGLEVTTDLTDYFNYE